MVLTYQCAATKRGNYEARNSARNWSVLFEFHMLVMSNSVVLCGPSDYFSFSKKRVKKTSIHGDFALSYRNEEGEKNARYIPTCRFIDFMPSQQTEKREIEFKNFSFFYHFIIREDKLIGSLSASAMTEAMKKREKRNTLREKKRASEEIPDTTSAAQRSTGQKRRGECTMPGKKFGSPFGTDEIELTHLQPAQTTTAELQNHSTRPGRSRVLMDESILEMDSLVLHRTTWPRCDVISRSPKQQYNGFQENG
ncbi:hypothetical protein PROFUN_15678 [Planoprotostelium fungivorum]|uniref:Uncharacterized protein n=1 Tax=Planoprotostelium fungivorum TaxID=1890364 RepID=A0A2P6MV48_9EUKA|nr:hypothetical protein PROFUN_15678 [Planoprotostelium fungivorum]